MAKKRASGGGSEEPGAFTTDIVVRRRFMSALRYDLSDSEKLKYGEMLAAKNTT